MENDAYSAFNSAFRILLNEHAPLKTKILRYNNKTFLGKQLRKEIMKRSKLKNLFNKTKNRKISAHLKFNVITVSNSYIKQRNNIVRI